MYDHCLIQAELHRNLGEFENCENVLSNLVTNNANIQAYISVIRTECENNNTLTVHVNFEAYKAKVRAEVEANVRTLLFISHGGMPRCSATDLCASLGCLLTTCIRERCQNYSAVIDRNRTKMTIEELTEENVEECLKIRDGGGNFVGSGKGFVAKSLVIAQNHGTSAKPLIIYNYGRPVGFLLFIMDNDSGAKNYYLSRFFMEYGRCFEGFAKTALLTAIYYVKQKTDCKLIRVSVSPERKQDISMYENLGFVPVNGLHTDEIVMTLRIISEEFLSPRQGEQQGLCKHCGGKLRGIFTKKCKLCGEKQ
jgi:hypothetical protein